MNTDFFVTIVHNSNKIRYLIILFNVGISNFLHSFCFWFETLYFLWCYYDYLINWIFEGLKKSNTFYLVSALIEAETGQGTVS